MPIHNGVPFSNIKIPPKRHWFPVFETWIGVKPDHLCNCGCKASDHMIRFTKAHMSQYKCLGCGQCKVYSRRANT